MYVSILRTYISVYVNVSWGWEAEYGVRKDVLPIMNEKSSKLNQKQLQNNYDNGKCLIGKLNTMCIGTIVFKKVAV